jgi:hypothetical protein
MSDKMVKLNLPKFSNRLVIQFFYIIYMRILTGEKHKIITITAFTLLLAAIVIVYLPVSTAYSEHKSLSSNNLENRANGHTNILSDNNSTLTSRPQSDSITLKTSLSASTAETTNALLSSPLKAVETAAAASPPIKQVTLANQTNTSLTKNNKSHDRVDKFGIKEIYPTKKGGREWYMNMNNPVDDTLFSVGGSSQRITKQTNDDDSWRNSDPKVRMRVTTPLDSAQWKNVEITGYVKVNSTNITSTHHYQKDIPNHIAWLARSGRHNDDVPCDGTDLSGGIRDDGSVGWKKEIWFTGGYTKELAQAKPTDSIVGRWIGWKVVMYNIANDTAVRMQSYLDDNNNNHWVKVTDIIDDGGWYADASDNEFYSADCGKPKDYIITDSGPVVMFRADNVILDFKNLSVREIEAI